MENSNSYKAGQQAAKKGYSIDNSYPFDHKEFQLGYKSINPNAKGLFNGLEDSLEYLQMMELIKKG